MTKTIEKATVAHGDPMPCHQSNIVHTERRQSGLEVWYVENTGEEQ